MCRHLAHVGPLASLSWLLLDAPHALVRQSWAPQDMRGGGTVNADGYGVGWYPDGESTPVRYRRDCPIWADAALPALAASTRASAVLAAVRSATAGMPTVETAAAPFTTDGWLFSHNGAVVGWPDTLVGLAAELPTRDLLLLDAPTDAALLWALVRHRLRAGASLVEAVGQTVAAVRRAAPGSRLNLLLTDGKSVVGSAAGHSLWVLTRAGGTTVASEPLDDDAAWTAVAEGQLVVVDAGRVDLVPEPDWEV